MANIKICRAKESGTKTIRITVQFYQATSHKVVTAADITAIANQIERIYTDADYVGGLVRKNINYPPK